MADAKAKYQSLIRPWERGWQNIYFLVQCFSVLIGKKALVMSFIIIMPLLFREECLLGISVHSVVSREFSFLFFVPQCFLCCLLSPDVPFLVVSADLPYLVPFFFRLPSDRDERPLSSARDPSIHSTEDNKNRVTMTIRSAAIECWTTNQRLLKSTNGVQRGTERRQLRVPPLVRLTILCCSTD